MRRLRALMVCLVLFCLGCLPCVTPTHWAQIDVLTQETAIIYGNDGNLTCAGVWVGPHEILTAYHCVMHLGETPAQQFICSLMDDECPVNDPSGRPVAFRGRDMEKRGTGTVKRISRKDDLALIDTGAAHAFVWAFPAMYVDPNQGQVLDVVGHPAGLPWVWTRAYVSSTHEHHTLFDEDIVDWELLSGDMTHGNSGGGAFDQEGRLVGICSHQYKGVPNLLFFVPLHTIQAFLGE
jgi:trypsin-like peptidase